MMVADGIMQIPIWPLYSSVDNPFGLGGGGGGLSLFMCIIKKYTLDWIHFHTFLKAMTTKMRPM